MARAAIGGNAKGPSCKGGGSDRRRSAAELGLGDRMGKGGSFGWERRGEDISISLFSVVGLLRCAVYEGVWRGGGEDDTNFSFFPISKLKIKTSLFFPTLIYLHLFCVVDSGFIITFSFLFIILTCW